MSTDTAVATTTRTVRIALKATPERVWQALVDGAETPAYYVGFTAEIDPTAGADYRYTAGGGDMITGTVLEAESGRRLVTTFTGLWDPEVAAIPESRVTIELSDTVMPAPGVTLLTCIHEDLPDTPVADHLELGWVTILSGLKTHVETGSPLVG